MIKRDERASDTSLLFYPLLGQFFFPLPVVWEFSLKFNKITKKRGGKTLLFTRLGSEETVVVVLKAVLLVIFIQV